jgi:uncharacterized repeat protein (TIGR01451 family)
MPERLRLLGRLALFSLIPFLRGGAGGSPLAAGNAGQPIDNQAAASLGVSSGGTAGALSNPVALVVAPFSGLGVSPDDIVASGTVAPGATAVRRFLVTNLGNRDDRFQITAATVSQPALLTGLFLDLDGNGAIDPTDPAVVPGAGGSPLLPPGASLGVLLQYSAAGAAAGTQVVIGLQAASQEPGAVNGLSSDSGTIRDQVGSGAIFSDPANPGQPPAKTVNGQIRINASRQQEVTFALSFANSGPAVATAAVVTDPLPAGFTTVPGTLLLDGSPLTDAADGDPGEAAGGAVTVRFPALAPGETHRIEFHARIDSSVAQGTLLSNKASFTASGVASIDSARALVLVDPFGQVFHAAGGSPLPGARVSLLSDAAGTLLALPPLPGTGATPNVDNTNPFAADSAGRFSFLFDPAVAGVPGSTETTYLRVTLPGFLSRRVQVDRVSSAGSTPAAPVFTLTLTALDGLPLASPGSFSLVQGPVVVPDVSAVASNIPLFPESSLVVTKVADRSHSRIGETIGYRVRITNGGPVVASGVVLTDFLPEFLDPVEGASRRITGGGAIRIDPVRSGRTLKFLLGDLPPGGDAEISYRARVAPGAPAEALSNEATASGLLPNGDPVAGGPARAVVFVRQGIFSFQQALIGRVFEDLDGNGHFDPGEPPLEGIRVVLDNGMSVLTDSQGLFSLPSVPEGARMIGLDASTYPPGLCPDPAPGDRLSDGGAYRLLRTPLRGGALLKQNFPLARRGDCHTGPAPPSRHDESAAAPAGETAAAPADGAPESGKPPQSGSLSPGTHVKEQTELLPPVPKGQVLVLEPADGAVSMTGALDIAVRTHRLGTVRVSVNDHRVEEDRLGQTDLDDRNQLATFRYVGIPLLPGPNRVVVSAITEEGGAGDTRELLVFGRGTAARIRLSAYDHELPADGRSSTEATVELLDSWDHPAQDTRVRVRTSAGWLSAGKEEGRDRDIAVASHDGVARLKLLSDVATGTAHLRADYGDLSDETSITFLPAEAPPLLVGMADVTVGAVHADPGVGKDAATPEDGAHGRVAFFYKGAFGPPGALMTAAYDSDRRLNRTADSGRLFDLDPLENTYPVMGDSSLRFEEAMSNSRAYLKLEKDRSYLLYGDFDPGMGDTRLAAYNRKLTGLGLHLENREGDRFGVAVARPDNAFAREVVPASGISGFYRLGHTPLIPGSETVSLEVHDRRNPEQVLSRQALVRGTDYDLDALAGTLLFKRPLDTFAGDFDLVEIVVLYEYQTTGFDSLSWNGSGRKRWNGGRTEAGFSAFGESPDGGKDFRLFAADLLQRLPGAGAVTFEAAHSDGRPMNQGNASLGPAPSEGGDAFRVEYLQKVQALRGPLRAAFEDVDADFVNPYGVSVTPGARRILLSAEPALSDRLKLGVAVQEEENRTATVDNTRTTGSLKLTGQMSDQIGFLAGLDHRDFDDRISEQTVESDLLTAGINYHPDPRWSLSARREQNLGAASDPSYPDGTFLTGGFQASQDLRYFLKFRDSSRPIEAIADVSAAGLTPPHSRSELQLGAETRLGSYSTLTSRYQVDNGMAGTDSFAVVGLGTRLPVSEELSVDVRGEAGLRVAGSGDDFESLSSGLSWLPREDFRATFRYELRSADGFGQTVSAAAVGKPGEDVTLVARLAASDASQMGRDTTVVDFLGGLALRPLHRDDYGLLFAWKRSDRRQGGLGPGGDVRTLSDTYSADGVLEFTPRVRFFGRMALTDTTDTPPGLPAVATTTTLAQSRLEYQLGRRWDVAGEVRDVILWQTDLRRDSLGLECGFWATGDLRLGLGYGFTSSKPLETEDPSIKQGFYFNLTTKLNRILELLRRNP